MNSVLRRLVAYVILSIPISMIVVGGFIFRPLGVAISAVAALTLLMWGIIWAIDEIFG